MTSSPSRMELRHLERETATALELALVAPAPTAVIEALASATGLLRALGELPLDTESLRLKASDAIERGERSLAEWREWLEKRKVIA